MILELVMLGAVLIFQEHGILGDTSVADWSVLGFMVVIAVCTLWQAVKPPVLRGFGVLVLIQSCVFVITFAYAVTHPDYWFIDALVPLSIVGLFAGLRVRRRDAVPC